MELSEDKDNHYENEDRTKSILFKEQNQLQLKKQTIKSSIFLKGNDENCGYNIFLVYLGCYNKMS